MDGEKRTGTGGSSSFASDLFGSKDSSSSVSSSLFPSSSAAGIFGSIFASNPPNMIVGRESLRTHGVEKKQDSANRGWNSKSGHSDSMHPNKQGESVGTWKDPNNTYYTQQNVQPCNLSSSIYYGGQDIYTTSYNSQSHDYSTFKKDQGEDDSGSASRGNWWQGGLYY